MHVRHGTAGVCGAAERRGGGVATDRAGAAVGQALAHRYAGDNTRADGYPPERTTSRKPRLFTRAPPPCNPVGRWLSPLADDEGKVSTGARGEGLAEHRGSGR